MIKHSFGLKALHTKLILSVIVFICIINVNVNAAVKSYQVKPDGVTFILNNGLMKVLICRDDIIEVKYTIFEDFQNKPSLVVNNTLEGHPEFKVNEQNNQVIITTKKLKIKINKATNAVVYTDLAGTIITSEDQQNKTMTPATIAGISTYNVSTRFNSPANEGLYGLGCHPLDSL